MRIWKLSVEFKNNESFMLNNDDKEFLNEFREKMYLAQRLNGQYDGENIKVIEGTEISDFPKLWNLSGTPLVSETSKNILYDLITDECEFIPLQYKETYYYLVNILTVLDALDCDKSVFKRTPSGFIIGISKYIFKEELLRDSHIFKIRLNGKINPVDVFVSDNFKNAVEDAELKGFKFVEVWSD